MMMNMSFSFFFIYLFILLFNVELTGFHIVFKFKKHWLLTLSCLSISFLNHRFDEKVSV